MAPDYPTIRQQIAEAIKPELGKGRAANYIPGELSWPSPCGARS